MRKRFSRFANCIRICQQDISNYEYHGQGPWEETHRIGREIIFTILYDKNFFKAMNKERQIIIV